MRAVLITSSILILLLAALRPLLRGRIDPRLQYALWLVVALRLLVPVEWASSAYSALALLERAEQPARVVQAIGQTTVPVPILAPLSDKDAFDLVMREREQNGQNVTDLSVEETFDVWSQVQNLQESATTLAALAQKLARPVWLGGAAMMGLWFLLVNFRLRRKLRTALPVQSSCLLPVRVTPDLPSPCLCGTFRPKIYVTPAALTDPDRLRHVLIHELTHHRHRDHWWALVRCACLCLYWFDPLVWWAAAMSRQDCELACDAGAIRCLGEKERIPYGRTLVAMIAAGRSSLLQTATTMTGGKRRVRERVRLIARKPRTMIAVVLALVLVLGCAVGCTFTGAPEDRSTPISASRPRQPLDTLMERLAELPEELRKDVIVHPSDASGRGPNILVTYMMNRDWTDMNTGMGFLLTLCPFTKQDFEGRATDWSAEGMEPFARSDDYYYVLRFQSGVCWPEGEDQAYHAALDAVRDFVAETVLATEGVEPFDPEQALAADALQAQLLELPEDLRDRVSASPAMGGEVGCLASYWLNDPKWADLWSGWLLDLYRMDEAQIQAKLDNGLWPAVHIFARGGGQYYALVWASDGRYQDGGALSEEYWAAVNTLRDHVTDTVLAAAGTEPFDPYTTPPHFFSNVKQPPMDPGAYAIDGMDYTPVTSHLEVPEDPEQWFLVGWLDAPVWMFTRSRGEETMFQVDGRLTQVFPYRACFYGGGMTPDGSAPQLRMLPGGGWGPRGTFGPFAVITHLFQGGTDQLYQLTVYDLDTDPVTAYVHDWKPLMEDFNGNYTSEIDPDSRTVTLSYQGQTAQLQFADDDMRWSAILEDGFSAGVWDFCCRYSLNSDGTADLIMPIDGAMHWSACWTIRFTGSGFETVGFHFAETNY